MLLQFLYFDGCPHANTSWANLIEACSILKLDSSHIAKIEVDTQQQAEKLNFPGSPSILINGKDIYTQSPPEGFHFACRSYDWPDGRSGEIPVKFIVEAIQKATLQ